MMILTQILLLSYGISFLTMLIVLRKWRGIVRRYPEESETSVPVEWSSHKPEPVVVHTRRKPSPSNVLR